MKLKDWFVLIVILIIFFGGILYIINTNSKKEECVSCKNNKNLMFNYSEKDDKK